MCNGTQMLFCRWQAISCTFCPSLQLLQIEMYNCKKAKVRLQLCHAKCLAHCGATCKVVLLAAGFSARFPNLTYKFQVWIPANCVGLSHAVIWLCLASSREDKIEPNARSASVQQTMQPTAEGSSSSRSHHHWHALHVI